MSTPETTNMNTTQRCWYEPSWPSDDLLSRIRVGSLAEARGAGEASLRARLKALRRETVDKPTVYIGTGTCGLGAGAGKTLAAMKDFLRQRGLDADIVEVGCIGLCHEEPLVDVQLPGKARVSFANVTPERAPELLEAMLVKQTLPADGVLGQFRAIDAKQWQDTPYLDEHPFLVRQRRVVLAGSGIVDPGNIDEYLARGGYSAAAKALGHKTPDEVCREVEISGLRGRGGGGFPTGKKWRFALSANAEQKYLICNADEGDPGAFMDRAVCESEPHRLLEGMLIAAYTIGATKAYIYIRAEYPLGIRRLEKALEQARAYGLLGENIFDGAFNLQIAIKKGAGAFVCGEETALINSIEGKRGMPRPRPPFPAVQGLFGKPTVINNVETLANLPMILDRGGEWFASMGTAGSKGTKVFALSGTIRRTGLVEVPMGTTLREVVHQIGGGIAGNRKCKAVQIGGPSGGCVPEAHLDLPADYEALKKFGTIMGSGGLVVVDETTCMVDFAKFFMEFIQAESCGKCIPCREGTKRMLEILDAIVRPSRAEHDIDSLLRFRGVMELQELAEMIKATSLCGLGQTAPNPVLSTLKWFRDEYEAHIYDRDCPAGACKDLVGVPCQNACPVGTETWRYVAHVARKEYGEAYRVIRQANPFPSVCARVCHHPCERSCRAGSTGGDPIGIRMLKRFVVDRVETPAGEKPLVAGPEAARVAVIGAGPSGLTAANCLSLLGYRVTIFERENQPGGMLTGAIPAYRLPREVLNKEIASLLNDNVELRCNQALGRDITVDGLLADGYKAVYVATGSHRSRKLGVPNEDVQGVIPGIQFLKSHNYDGVELAQGKVGIVGGGNSAMDAARVAIRQKGVTSVTVFYRRTRDEMPAYGEEVEAGLAEGVKLETLVVPGAVRAKNGKLTGMQFTRSRLGERDASGRRQPVVIPGSEFEVELDTLVAAISEEPEGDLLEGLDRTKWKSLAVNPESYLTSRPGVFGGGDVVTGPATVIEAVAAGKNAARMIDRYIKGKLLKVLPKLSLPSTYIAPVELMDEDGAGQVERAKAPDLPVSDRKGNFKEVEKSLCEEAALCEAGRCLRCDLAFTEPS